MLIDKLLQAVVKQGASDLHITVGPAAGVAVARPHAAARDQNARRRTTPSALMKSITPDRCQQELQEVGGSDFGFAFGDAARFRVSIFKQRGNIGMVLRQIPNKLLTHGAAGPARRSAKS